MHEAEMRHHRLARGLGITGQNGVEHRLVLFGQLSKHRRDQIHALAALLHGGLQQVEEPAHGLEQHHVVRRLGNRQVKAHVRLGGDIRVAALRGLKAGDEFLFVGLGCPHGRVPGGTGFDGVTRFKDVEAVVRVVLHQRFQRLNDVLLGPVVMLPAYKGAAAATAYQHPFADQRCQRLAQ